MDKQSPRREFDLLQKEVPMKSRVVTLAVVAVVAAVWLSVNNKTFGAERPRQILAARVQDLDLTDEQEGKIADIRKEYRPKVESAAKELAGVLREEGEKVKAVLTVEQLDELRAAREARESREERRSEHLAERLAHVEELGLTDAEMAKLEAIRQTFRPKITNDLGSLDDVLTDEQKVTREEGLKAGKRRKDVFASLNLTDEQKQKLKAIGKDLRTIVRGEMEGIRDVLTPEQRDKLTEFKDERREEARDRIASAIANSKDFNLTDEQKSQIAAIRQEFRPKVQEAGNQLRTAARGEVESIVVILKE
jgi:Spy/CpxP family protein refolding chaperone